MFGSWAQGLASSLRSGQPVASALESAVRAAPDETPDGARRAVAELIRGGGLRRALDTWRGHAQSTAERLVVVALLVSVDRGAEAAPAVDSAIESLRDDAMLESRQRVLTAQARASATVLVVLPVGFGVVTSLLRGEVIYRGSIGIAIVGIGLLLDLTGFAWMRRLRRRLL